MLDHAHYTSLQGTEDRSTPTHRSAIFAAVTGDGWMDALRRVRGTRKWQLSLGLLAVLCFVVAAGAVEQEQLGWNELSHFGQVRAFDRGTPIIDRYQRATGDKAYYHGHYYSDKAPGLALLTVPVYHIARTTHLERPGGQQTVHLLVIFGCTIPVAVIMLLGCWLVQRREPGQGPAVAVTLGLGTLLLPFATVFFSHVLSACLGFAAFCLLWRERERGHGLALIAGAGVLTGYAVSTEYPLAILAVLFAVYVAWREKPIKPLLAYGIGGVVGLLPLLLYDWWAFGSPFHLSYSYVAANSSGVLGLGAPNLRNAVRLLVSDRGLFVVTPVVAAGIAGIAILWREGRRMDALFPAVVVLAYFVYNVCYYLPFGGGVPGPRFLITMLPFLAVPLGTAYRKAPITTSVLGIASAVIMTVATLAGPDLSTESPTSTWWKRLELGHFRTPISTVWIFGIFAVLAILIAVVATPKRRIARLDLELAALCLGSWFAITRAGPALLASDLATKHVWGMLVLIVLVVALAATITRLASGDRLALFAGIPLVALAVRRFDHTTLALVLVALSLCLLAWRMRQRRPVLKL